MKFRKTIQLLGKHFIIDLEFEFLSGKTDLFILLTVSFSCLSSQISLNEKFNDRDRDC